MVAILLALMFAMLPQSTGSTERYPNWYYVVEKRFGVPGTFSSMPDVDFRNLQTYLVTADGTIEAVRKLKDGHYSRPWSLETGFQDISLEEVHIVPSDPGKPQHAVVTFYDTSGGASSCSVGFIQVFELSEHGLLLTQHIQFGARGGGYRFDWNQGSLRFDAVDFCDDIEPYKLRVHFRWDGARFQRKSVGKVPRPDR